LLVLALLVLWVPSVAAFVAYAVVCAAATTLAYLVVCRVVSGARADARFKADLAAGASSPEHLPLKVVGTVPAYSSVVALYAAELSERLLREAGRRVEAYDGLGFMVGQADVRDSQVRSRRAELLAELHGLRVALCLAQGWDPAEHAIREGKADQMIMTWVKANTESGVQDD
jgi:hypothetical protein